MIFQHYIINTTSLFTSINGHTFALQIPPQALRLLSLTNGHYSLLLALKGRKDRLAPKVSKVLPAFLVLKDSRGLKGCKVFKATVERKDLRENKGSKGRAVLKDNKGLLALKAHKAKVQLQTLITLASGMQIPYMSAMI